MVSHRLHQVFPGEMPKTELVPPVTPHRLVIVGFHWMLLGLNSILILTGMAMIILGVKLEEHSDIYKSAASLPHLWWLGLMPLLVGAVGLLSTAVGKISWIVGWSVYSIITSTACYAFFTRSGCFDHAAFGVTLRIYGNCYNDEGICKCILSPNKLLMTSNHSCETIYYTTSVYLSQLSLLTLSLASIIIGCCLGLFSAYCLKIYKIPEEMLLLPPGSSGYHSTPLHQKLVQSALYMTDLIPTSRRNTTINSGTML